MPQKPLPGTTTTSRTPADELRQILTTLEKRLARLSDQSPQQALEILALLDQAELLRQRLRAAGMDPKSEETYLETIHNQFQSQAARYLSQIGGARALVQARQARPTEPQNWWWQIDQWLAERRRIALRRALIGAGLALIVIVVGVLLYQRYLAPDPEYIARISYQQVAENALLRGDYEVGLQEVEAALEIAPEEVELLILKGLLLEVQGELEAAAEAYQQAEQNASSPAAYYEKRAAYYLMAGLYEQTIQAADQAIAANPQSIMGYLHKAQAYDSQNLYPQALENYEKADELAQNSGNAQLQVIVRVNMSNLLQRYQSAIPTIEVQP